MNFWSQGHVRMESITRREISRRVLIGEKVQGAFDSAGLHSGSSRSAGDDNLGSVAEAL